MPGSSPRIPLGTKVVRPCSCNREVWEGADNPCTCEHWGGIIHAVYTDQTVLVIWPSGETSTELVSTLDTLRYSP